MPVMPRLLFVFKSVKIASRPINQDNGKALSVQVNVKRAIINVFFRFVNNLVNIHYLIPFVISLNPNNSKSVFTSLSGVDFPV